MLFRIAEGKKVKQFFGVFVVSSSITLRRSFKLQLYCALIASHMNHLQG